MRPLGRLAALLAALAAALALPACEVGDSQAAVSPSERGDEVVVHRHSGRRASAAEQVLRGASYTNVRHLTVHWQEWQEARLPTE